MKISDTLKADAYAFVSGQLGGNDLSELPFDAIKKAVEKLYDGGWQAFEAAFNRACGGGAKATEQWSPIKQKAIVEAMTKIRLSEYDEIVKFSLDQQVEATFVVSRASVIDRRARRDIITEREITLYKFVCYPTGWHKDSVTITESVNEVHHRFGSVNTVTRAADKKEQFENCYRPGTSRTPLQGWVARLELSWKQAHADEVFPIVSKGN